jgi:hypothetical protein
MSSPLTTGRAKLFLLVLLYLLALGFAAVELRASKLSAAQTVGGR